MAKPKQTAIVVHAIMATIEDGLLLPGDAIDEKQLMTMCDVSRTPVREALIHLEADGLVVRHPRKGVSLFHPNTDEFLSILEVHASLEAQAAELAARRISEDQAAVLRSCAQACSEFADDHFRRDPAEYYRLNMHFHAAVAEAACNPFLLNMIKLNARKLMAHYRLRYQTPGAIEKSAAEHQRIADHILSHNSEQAQQLMQSHFNYSRETVMHMIASVR